MKYSNKNQKGFAHPFLLGMAVVAIGTIGFAVWRVSVAVSNNNKAIQDSTSSFDSKSELTAEAVLKEKKTSAPTEDVAVPSAATQNKSTRQTPAPASSKPVTKPSTPVVTNCGTPLYKGSSTAFMASDTYGETPKFKAALEFAGLSDTVNANKTVVFTMSDTLFESLSAEQEAFMNASPANMKSVLGWHVVQSCQTYAAVFREATKPVTIQTLNGPVTYTTEGHGFVGEAEIAIWDWFTTNGAVHYIKGFIKPPQV